MTQTSELSATRNAPVALPHRRLADLLTGSVASIAVTLLLVIVVGITWVGPRFLSTSNITIIGLFVAVPILVGACAGFALLAGVVDLSIGSMVGISAAIFAALVQGGFGPWPAGAVALLACVIFGTINAMVIVVFGADAIAATLGMLTALRGLARLILGSQGAIAALVSSLFAFTNISVWSLPLLFMLALLVVVIAAVIVNMTRLGRHIQAVGGDDRAATRAGISVPRMRFAALLLSALGAGLGGILYAGQLGSASNALGVGLEFQVYAALMIGGYSILRGGVGNPIGGAMGLLVVAGVANILDVQAISPYFVNIIVGLLLLAAVLLDRLRGGDAYE